MISALLRCKPDTNINLIICHRLMETLLLLYEESEVKAVASDEPFFGSIEEGSGKRNQDSTQATARTSVFEDYVSHSTARSYEELCMNKNTPPSLVNLLFRLCAK